MFLVEEGTINECKTDFKTPIGHFEHKVMPFGHRNAVFQALVNDVLC